MRGLSTLTTSRAHKQGAGLQTLSTRKANQQQYSSLSSPFQQQYQSRGYYPCAYHVGQKITNFCTNQSCLLPLCPKCIKIHSQQHERIGVYGSFPSVQECLTQCQVIQNSSILRLQQMSLLCQQMSGYHRQQLTLCQSQLQNAKKQLIQYIDSIFHFYEHQTNKIIVETSREYQEQLVMFQKEILSLAVSQRQLMRKAESQNTRMEFLIDFHAKQDLTTLLNQHAATIDCYKPDYLQLNINTYQLERIKVIIKKYLDFGQYNQTIQQKLQRNPIYKRVTIAPIDLNPNPNLNPNPYTFASLVNNQQKQFTRSPIKNLFSTPPYIDSNFKSEGQNYGFTQKGEIVKIIEEKLNKESRLDKFRSPLEAYSLEKSRQSRT